MLSTTIEFIGDYTMSLMCAIGVLVWLSEYKRMLPSEWPECMTGYIVLQDTNLTGLLHGIDNKFEAFYISHTFICLSYEPDTHFYLAEVHETLLTLYPWPTKQCNCLPVDVENTCTDRSLDPVNNF